MAVKVFTILVLVAILGVGGYYAFQYYKLEGEYAALQEDLEQAENKTLKFQERYRQQKAVEANLKRTKLTLEGRIRALEQQVEELEGEKTELIAANQALKSRMSNKIEDTIARLESEKAKLKKQLQKAEQEIAAEKRKLKACVAEREKTVNAMQAEIDGLSSNLENEQALHGQCREHNTRLSELGIDILDAYYDKGPLESVMQAEPLIQSKQIQLEKIIQEYKDEIDEHTLFTPR